MLTSSLFQDQIEIPESQILQSNIEFIEVLFAYFLFQEKVSGGDNRARTDDPLLAKQVLSQLSYTPIERDCGGPKWTRTTDLTIISRAL